MSWLVAIASFALVWVGAGCVILPVPHQRTHAYGVKAQVVDAECGHPIEGATVMVLPGRRDGDDHASAREGHTDARGQFRVRPDIRWHGVYQYGVISHSLLPSFCGFLTSYATVTVHAPGYAPARYYVATQECMDDRFGSRDGDPGTPATAALVDEYLVAGRLTLQRQRLPASTQSAEVAPHGTSP